MSTPRLPLPLADQPHPVMGGLIRSGHLPLVLVVLAACALGLWFPLHLPLGPFNWDTVLYLDGGQRVLDGQIPSVDFFAPVGPLGYWLFATGLALFPSPQPVLLAQWMLLAVTLPPLLPTVLRLRPALGWALLLPFVFFQLVPLNAEQYGLFPSFDGYGFYNRHVAQLLYVLVTVLLFERRAGLIVFTVAWCCTALFLLKITGFVTAGLICLFALAAGRISLRAALLTAALFAAVLAGLEVTTGLVSHYIGDIVSLVKLNEGGLASRLLQAASIHFGTFGSGCALLLGLAITEHPAARARLSELARRRDRASLSAVFDQSIVWLGALLACGIFFESQNTGDQAFIFLWPLLLRIFGTPAARRLPILVLIGAVALPPFVGIAHRLSRALVGQMQYVDLDRPQLKNLGQVDQRPELLDRARESLDILRVNKSLYEDYAGVGLLPFYSLYADIDFQMTWLLATDDAVTAIKAFEAREGVRFETIMALNFVNPYPYLLDRHATPRIPIGADPTRAVPNPDADTIEAVRNTDLILYPTCPVTLANMRLREIYQAGLANHREVKLSDCWIGYVRTAHQLRP